MGEKRASELGGNSVQGITKSESGDRQDLQEKRLAPREREVVILLSEGNTNKQIAAILKLSPRTIEAYRASLMRKLELRSFPELIRYAVRHEIVSAEMSKKSTPKGEVGDAPGASPPIELSDAWLYALNMSDEFRNLQSSFKAIQRRFEKAKTFKERRELLVNTQEILSRARLLTEEFRANGPAQKSKSYKR